MFYSKCNHVYQGLPRPFPYPLVVEGRRVTDHVAAGVEATHVPQHQHGGGGVAR